MRIEYLIDQAGQVVANVLDRQGENCAAAVTQAGRLGSVLSDERTGPDCDTVHEGVGGGDPQY